MARGQFDAEILCRTCSETQNNKRPGSSWIHVISLGGCRHTFAMAVDTGFPSANKIRTYRFQSHTRFQGILQVWGVL